MSDDQSPAQKIAGPAKLAAHPFEAVFARDKVIVKFHGRIVRTLTGKEAVEVRTAKATGNDLALQLVLAKVTRNFKRGNER